MYVVNAESKAELKPVVVTQSFGTDAVVTGIEAGAKVVLEGKQNLRPGAVVKERADDAKEGDKSGKREKPAAAAKASEQPAASSSASAASAS